MRFVSYSPSIVTMPVFLTVYDIFSVKEERDVENWVRCCSRSLKMAPFDRSYTTFYWSAIVNIAMSCTVLSYLTLNNIVTLKSGLEVAKGHSNWYHSKVGCGFIFAFHSNYLASFRKQGDYWSKIVIFFIPPCIRCRRYGGPSRILPSRLVRKN